MSGLVSLCDDEMLLSCVVISFSVLRDYHWSSFLARGVHVVRYNMVDATGL
jgi:hypothetical protein